MNQSLLARLNELKGMRREVESHWAVYWPVKNKTAVKLTMIDNEIKWIKGMMGVKN